MKRPSIRTAIHTALRTVVGAAALAGAFASAGAWATESSAASKPAEASIPFVQYGGIRDWVTDRDRGVWIQDSHRNWYYAKVMGPCSGLNFATRLGFDTRPVGTFDRFSSIIVPREGRCAVQSFEASDGPPRKQKVSATGDVAVTADARKDGATVDSE